MPPVICWATPAISCWDHSKMSDIHPREMDLLRGFAQTEKLTCLTAAGRNIPVIMYGAVHEDESGRRLIRAIVIDNLRQRIKVWIAFGFHAFVLVFVMVSYCTNTE